MRSQRSDEPPPLPMFRGPQLAGLGIRLLALLVDVLPVGILTAFLLIKILLPLYHGHALNTIVDALDDYYQAVYQAEASGTEPPSPPDFTQNPGVILLFSFSHQVMFIAFFIYFGLCEWLLRGTSLGKMMFSIRTVMADSGEAPNAIQALLRGMLKAFGLIGLPPWTLISYLLAFALSARRTGHDVLCRTLVVEGSPPRRISDMDDDS